MARIVKEEEYAVKRNAILDVAQRLIYNKGYEQMTIQDILEDLQISKGAFYHYFDSKQALLEAIIERMQEEVEQLLIPIVQDPHMPALEKLQRFFDTVDPLENLAQGFLSRAFDVSGIQTTMPLCARNCVQPRSNGSRLWLSLIIHQGIQEGVLTTSYPERVGEVILSLVLDLSDTLGELLLSFKPERDTMLRIEGTVAAYTDALERTIGIPEGSLSLADSETLKEWFVSPRDNI